MAKEVLAMEARLENHISKEIKKSMLILEKPARLQKRLLTLQVLVLTS